MPTAPDPSAAESADRPSRSRKRLDGRTLGICVCVALLAATAAGLIVHHFVKDSKGSSSAASPNLSLRSSNPDKALHSPLTTFDGKKTTLAANLGTPMVVNLWASTCTPCLTEMPALEKAHQRHKDTVKFIGVDVRDLTSAGKKMIRRTGISYYALQDRSGDFSLAAEAVGLPTTLLIDKKGHVVASHTGAMTGPELDRLIKDKLSG